VEKQKIAATQYAGAYCRAAIAFLTNLSQISEMNNFWVARKD
jgi:hypothetical protein